MCPEANPWPADPEESHRSVINVCCCINNLHHRQPTTGAGEKSPNRTHPTLLRGRGNMVLLRKEVIQPHLPVRLPCYDFVPIADPTFDGSLHKG